MVEENWYQEGLEEDSVDLPVVGCNMRSSSSCNFGIRHRLRMDLPLARPARRNIGHIGQHNHLLECLVCQVLELMETSTRQHQCLVETADCHIHRSWSYHRSFDFDLCRRSYLDHLHYSYRGGSAVPVP